MTTGFDRLKAELKSRNIVVQLIIINVAVFLITLLVRLAGFLFNSPGWVEAFVGVLQVPYDLSELVFKPWTLFTYMFAHSFTGLGHIFFNMLILFFGGRILLSELGKERVLATYILSGLAGAVLFILAFNIFPVFETVMGTGGGMVGASAAVIGILVAAATYAPNLQVNLLFLGAIKLKWIALFFILLDMVNLPNGNAGGHIAHLGGAIYGFSYIQSLKRGNDWSKLVTGIGAFFTNLFKPKPKMRVVDNKRTKSNAKRFTRDENDQAVIDSILDKISRSGYDSLTKKEKEILFKAGDK